MSYSSGRSCHLLLFFTIITFFFLLLLTTSPATVASAADHDNNDDDGGGGSSSSGTTTAAVITPSMMNREEMVQLAGYGEEKLSTVLVTGSLVCHACSPLPPSSSSSLEANSYDNHDHDGDQLHEWPIPGVLVAVNCLTRGNQRRPAASAQTVTDEFGDFTIDLPSELHGIPEMDKACCVKVLRMPKNSTCRPAYHVQQHKALKLSSAGDGIRNYSAGKIQFLHSASKPLQACSKDQT